MCLEMERSPSIKRASLVPLTATIFESTSINCEESAYLLFNHSLMASNKSCDPITGGYFAQSPEELEIISLTKLGGLCWGSPSDRDKTSKLFGGSKPWRSLRSRSNG